MPNLYIVEYLKKNKDKFSFEILEEKLLKAGYPISEIEEAAKIVYKTPSPLAPKPINFWDFWHKKVYTSGKEKPLDFISGFIFAIVFGYILKFLFYIMDLYGFFYYILSSIVYLVLIIYFLIKRKYIALGIICEIILSLLRHYYYF